jgi:hypothetical protein
MTNRTDLLALVHRVKRQVTNRDILTICEELERYIYREQAAVRSEEMLAEARKVADAGNRGRASVNTGDAVNTVNNKANRNAYHREYMRKKRAQTKTPASELRKGHASSIVKARNAKTVVKKSDDVELFYDMYCAMLDRKDADDKWWLRWPRGIHRTRREAGRAVAPDRVGPRRLGGGH